MMGQTKLSRLVLNNFILTNKIALKFSVIILLFCQNALADHPNEGKTILSELILEAQKDNLNIKEQAHRIESLKKQYSYEKAKYYPQLAIEGGPQSSQFDHDKSSGSSLYAKLDWNLYRGGLDQSSIELAQSQVQAHEKNLRALKNILKNEVSKIYYELQFILESIALKQKAIELNSQQMKVAKVKNNSGIISSSDVLEFDLRESTLNSDLIFLNQQLEIKSKELNSKLSRESNSSVEKVKGHLTRENIRFVRTEIIQKIHNQNSSLNEITIEIAKNENEKKGFRSQYLPSINLEGRYGKLATEENIFNQNNNYYIGLKFNLPLFSGFESLNAFQSMNEKILANQKAFDQKIIELNQELDSLLIEVRALNQRLDIEEKNIERSEKYYQLTLIDYRRGIKNSPDMVVASERLLDARIRNLEYRRDLKLAQLKILSLAGE